MHYRREIDGLRALAVLPVMLFHAGVSGFGGGFVGVDVFFVVSGYLITSIILSEQQAGTFSLLNFYERRARRILPALLVVMVACIPFSWLWMLPDDFENFGQSLSATAVFSNNVLLWLTSGYFALANTFKPLVHTWSLGVEEQFYLLYPALLLLLGLTSIPRLALALSALAILSLALAFFWNNADSLAAFLLLPPRAWQLMAGGLAALAHVRGWLLFTTRAADGLSLVGVAAIIATVVMIDPWTGHPVVSALAATLGAVLVVLFASPATVVGHILGTRGLVGIGLISYSAYLWHQPLFAFARLTSLEEPSVWFFVGLILVALAMAALTWRFLEQPCRDRRATRTKPLILVLAGMSLALAGTGYVIHAKSGFATAWRELDIDIRSADRKLNAAFNRLPEVYRDRPFDPAAHRKILVLGNSFARDFINMALENGYFSASSISYTEDVPTCFTKTAATSLAPLSERIAQADYIILGSAAVSIDCWRADFTTLHALGRAKIIVFGTKNFGWNNNGIMRLPAEQRHAYRARILPHFASENAAYAKAISPDYYVDKLAMLTDAEGRVPVFTDRRKFISQDTRHLTKDGARFVGNIVFEHPLLRELK